MRWKRIKKNEEDWNPWFAWRPVEIGDTGVVVFLEWIERMMITYPYDINYEYRLQDKQKEIEG